MIRQFLLASASALAFATPLAAQTSTAPQGSGLDTSVPADEPTPQPVAKTGNAILDRLNELEAKVAALE